ncbi:MAG: hypothetical protein U0Z53_29085 [Blastocatellia bacterium]
MVETPDPGLAAVAGRQGHDICDASSAGSGAWRACHPQDRKQLPSGRSTDTTTR